MAAQTQQRQWDNRKQTTKEWAQDSESNLFDVVLQEIGYTHMRIVEGVNSLLQLSGLVARMCSKVTSQSSWKAGRT